MAPSPFKGLVIVASGTFPGYKQADLKVIVEKGGGVFGPKVTDECTHLISTQKDFDGKSTKNKQAASVDGCKVVSIDWLLDCEKSKKRLKEDKYIFGVDPAKDASQAVDTSQAANGAMDAGVDVLANKKKSSKKRSQSAPADADADEGPPSKKQKDGQVAKEKSLHVPIDEGCSPSYCVYIDDSDLIWDATLNQTNATANNNKFYRIQLLVNKTDFRTWTRWGRVGEAGQSSLLGDGSLMSATRLFEKKFKDKSGLSWKDRLAAPRPGKYMFIERSYEEDSSSEEEDNKKPQKRKKEEQPEEEKKVVESTLPAQVQTLLAFIFNQQHFLSAMADMSYDANKLPLGKLSKRTIQTGFQILKDLSELLTNPSLGVSRYGIGLNPAVEQLSNRYFSTIPHAFGRNRPPVVGNEQLIKKEVELLESLGDMGIANEIIKSSKEVDSIHPLDKQFQSLCLEEMTPLDNNSTEFKELEDYLLKSQGHTHSIRFKVEDIFRINRKGEHERFAKVGNSCRRLLWHGSRSTNFGGILSQGLRIAPPEAPVSGYMFGKGVYFADISSKSANYCCSWSSGHTGLLLLCDVELGNPLLELTNSNYNAGDDAKAAGHVATLGLGRTIPQGWKDAECVNPDLKGILMPDTKNPPEQRLPAKNAYLEYNEYIVYDVAQICQRYLFRVRMT
ncbi:hypothetical protein Egran_03129 [Elaphomyces granulatus]|uniref:Poly [ADP-ribose] polymerase n=1 Tax=Elaphomyces granulatus TaxID=519963 RepID=A0A232LY93_9EURO|nr:hypothetical protein Egran_03129 [Elaphomyces granulatus]